jgi:hypothetical protein
MDDWLWGATGLALVLAALLVFRQGRRRDLARDEKPLPSALSDETIQAIEAELALARRAATCASAANIRFCAAPTCPRAHHATAAFFDVKVELPPARTVASTLRNAQAVQTDG